MATEVAYYTYIYATVDRQHYQKVTGFTRSATLSGRFFAGVVSQLLVSFHLMNLRELNYITLGCKSHLGGDFVPYRNYLFIFTLPNIGQITAFLWAIALPWVSTSVYFYAKTPAQIEGDNQYRSAFAKPPEPVKAKFSGKRAVSLLWTHFKNSYTDTKVVQWSVWWALATCGFMQVRVKFFNCNSFLLHQLNCRSKVTFNYYGTILIQRKKIFTMEPWKLR